MNTVILKSAAPQIRFSVCFAPCRKDLMSVFWLIVHTQSVKNCFSLAGQASAVDKRSKGRKVTALYLIPLRVHFLSRTTCKIREICRLKFSYANVSSLMILKCDICKDKSLVLHLPTALANSWYKNPPFSIIALCFNPLLCTGCKIYKRPDIYADRESASVLQIGVGDSKRKEKWLE